MCHRNCVWIPFFGSSYSWWNSKFFLISFWLPLRSFTHCLFKKISIMSYHYFPSLTYFRKIIWVIISKFFLNIVPYIRESPIPDCTWSIIGNSITEPWYKMIDGYFWNWNIPILFMTTTWNFWVANTLQLPSASLGFKGNLTTFEGLSGRGAEVYLWCFSRNQESKKKLTRCCSEVWLDA